MDYSIFMMLSSQRRVPASCPLREYLEPFAGHMKDPFLTHYNFALGDKSIATESYTRGDFWNLTLKCIATLLRCDVKRGDKHVHYFSGNTVSDLALRLASVILGTVPVTVNWQADSFDLVAYKIEITSAKVVIVDERTPHIADIQARFPNVKVITTDNIACTVSYGGDFTDIPTTNGTSHVGYDDTRCIIFTSGTTGRPKGVELTYANYRCNRDTFESFIGLTDQSVDFIPIVVNPMHHTNSTSITDWALRRVGSHIHLLDRYTTQYWDVLIQIHRGLKTSHIVSASGDSKSYRVIAPMVSRHIDFLDSLMQSGHFADADELTSSLCLSTLLLGSAPVGPTTCHRLIKYAGHLPTVRFGSTETTLQVCGIPYGMTDAEVMAAFERGWNHSIDKTIISSDEISRQTTSDNTIATSTTTSTTSTKEASPGYYIGREHFPFTEVRVVASVNPDDKEHYLKECAEGVPGYIITRGGHVFRRYVGVTDEVTCRVCSSSRDNRAVDYTSTSTSTSTSVSTSTTNTATSTTSTIEPEERWYLNLGDIGFYLLQQSSSSGGGQSRDIYWQTRDSHMLIRGGSNYAYEQIMSELTAFITRRYGLGASCFTLAVVGIKVTAISEHEDQCCVMMQLKEGETEVGGEGGGLPVLTPEQLATIATTSSTAPSGSSSSSDSNDSDSTMSLWLQWGALLQATFVAYANEASAGISKGAKPSYFAVVGGIPVVASKGVTDAPAVARYFKDRL